LDEKRLVAWQTLRDERLLLLDRRQREVGSDPVPVVLGHRDAFADLFEDDVWHGATV